MLLHPLRPPGVGGLCGLKEIGGSDWYRDGARYIVEHQGDKGEWASTQGDPQPHTCFALAFLSRATSSVSGTTIERRDLYGGDDPRRDVSLRASGDTPLTVWVSYRPTGA